MEGKSMNAVRALFTCILLAGLLLAGCGESAAEPPTPAMPTTVPATATETPQPPTPTNTPLPTNTPKPTNTPLPTATPTPEIPPEVLEQMESIQSFIGANRGLEDAEVPQEIMAQDEVGEYMLGELAEEYTQEEEFQDLITLGYLGLITPTFDLRDFYTQLYEEQLLGFYDIEEDRMVLIAGEDFGPLERMTYAHEYTHARQDATYDIDNRLGYNDESCDQDSERCAAIQALLEGDASLASAFWMMGNASETEQQQIMAESSAPQPVLESAPLFLQKEFVFPYEKGTEFVGKLYEQGMWPAVNAAYENPPVSTEQILHPERYPDDVPLEVILPDLLPVLGEGWELLDSDTLGEFYTYLMLTAGVDPKARIADGVAQKAAEGWGGDRFDVYHNKGTGQTVLVLKSQWDSSGEAVEFATQLKQHVLARFNLGDEMTELTQMFIEMGLGHAQMQQVGVTVYYVLSPSEEISLAVLDAVME
jgi:hypothetical protein